MSLTDEDVEWLKAYVSEVVAHFTPLFGDGRFQQGDALIKKFEAGLELVLRDGKERFRALDETHNEICVAGALLALTDPRVLQLDYEPVLGPSGRSIDFRAVTADGRSILVDVKTIRPKARDRWDQFERVTKEGWLPDDVSVVLDKDWLGGEIWHSMFASRSRMLEYTLELESKIGEIVDTEGTIFVIALCGRAYDWHEDELEDFVSFYRSRSATLIRPRGLP